MISINGSFIIFYQKDSDDRFDNLSTLIKFINTHYCDHEINVVQQFINEQDKETHDNTIFDNENVNHFILDEYSRDWNKMKGYNLGANKSKYDNLIFNDVDVIFGPNNVKEAFLKIENDNNKIIVPADPFFIDITNDTKKEFLNNFNYEFLISQCQPFKGIMRFSNGKISVNNVNGPGGGICLSKKLLFSKLKGFNPNFKGWGFEDDETRNRFLQLGYPVTRLQGFKPLFHMHHDNNLTVRGRNRFFYKNKEEYDKIRGLKYDDLIKYMDTWI